MNISIEWSDNLDYTAKGIGFDFWVRQNWNFDQIFCVIVKILNNFQIVRLEK